MGTAIVGIILVAVVAAIIVSQIKNKKKGKSSCGNNCAHCAMGGSCHKEGEVSPSLPSQVAPRIAPASSDDSLRFVGLSATPSAGTPRNTPRLLRSKMSGSTAGATNAPYVTVLHIDGMMCGMCESHINDAIRNNFSVKSVKSSHKKGITEITSDTPLDEEKLRKVIADTGYTLTRMTVA